ncbi:MAG: ABC transporter permease subunit [Actinomycetota bacterium]
MASTAAEVKGKLGRREAARLQKPPGGAKRGLALLFLLPALVLLGVIVVYPTIDTIIQSFQNTDREFVGVDNFSRLIRTDRMVQAIQNNAIWVATAPAIITALGLMFALLTERVKYATAIKIIVFMPMAISFLATGVIWRLMYEVNPDLGLVNAGIRGAANVIGGKGVLVGATPSVPDAVQISGREMTTAGTFDAGEVAMLGLTAIAPDAVPEGAVDARQPEVGSGEVGALVWRDFKPGGGEPGVAESEELGLPGAEVELLTANGDVVASGTTDEAGAVVFTDFDASGPFNVRLPEDNFATGFTGTEWLGPRLVTPAIIGAFSWMWAGFAVVVIGAGLAALPRDVLEAARVDGASEWQTFRHVTLPLLAPVLGVVFVTLVINVLKIFDIVLVTAPGASQDEANVIALEMWKTAFATRNFGLGSAVAVVLFLLVIPVMWLNIRRFRREQ